MSQPQPSPLQVAFFRAERSLREYSKNVSSLQESYTLTNGLSTPSMQIVIYTKKDTQIEEKEGLLRKAKEFLFEELEGQKISTEKYRKYGFKCETEMWFG